MLFLKRLSDLFDQERERLGRDLKARGMADYVIATQLESTDKYDFFVPEEARWSKIRHLKTNVGTALNKALEALEEANADALQDVLKHINFNRKIGQRTLDDDILANFIQNFEKIPLRDENFEFPDLLGATYESYLRADQRACLAALENLHAKYAVTAKQIEVRRDAATAKLQRFLKELGYA